MPKITIDGRECDFRQGQMILQVANDNGIEIPQYCYHDGLSIVASCRICLVEVWAPNPRNDNKLEPIPKLLPSCQTPAGDGQVVHSRSPKAMQNQKAVMEYLLINHPLDCPVCDQSGECFLQDYSYKYGRSASRFEDTKVKQPKKDLGPHVYLYADRCIMCSRCVRFTREVSGTSELMVLGRGNQSQIDVFPGKPIDNPLSANVNDLCPVGALLDKDFLFAQRVWFLKGAPSIDGLTSSGDNIRIDHNEGRIYRIKPRTNPEVNKWWITDEVRYGWKHVHSEARLRSPMRRQFGALVECDFNRAYDSALDGIRAAAKQGGRLAVVVSPMLSCEEAFLLARLARALDERAFLAVGPIPTEGEDRVFPPHLKADDPKAFIMRAEKAPNARGVRRALEAVAGDANSADGRVLSFDELVRALGASSGRDKVGALILTGNYPSEWATDELRRALARPGTGAAPGLFTILIDTLGSSLIEHASVVLPGATWAEKSGTFENATGRIQAFEQAIPPIEMAKPEGQIALDLLHLVETGENADRASGGSSPAPGRLAEAFRTAAPSQPPGRATPAGARSPAAEAHGPTEEDAQASRDTRRTRNAPPSTEGYAQSHHEAGSGGAGGVAQPAAVRAATRRASIYNAANVRNDMATAHPGALAMFTTDAVELPVLDARQEADMEMVEL